GRRQYQRRRSGRMGGRQSEVEARLSVHHAVPAPEHAAADPEGAGRERVPRRRGQRARHERILHALRRLMTFKHKLSARLALMKDRVVAVSAVLLAAAVVFACERPVLLTDTGSGTVAQLLVYPKSMTIRTGQTADFMAVALTRPGDRTDAAGPCSATDGR